MEEIPIRLPALKSPDDGLWRDRALCKNMGNDVFFKYETSKGSGRGRNEAIKICLDCTVRTECLRFAVDNDIAYGVWGGMTSEQRKRYKSLSQQTV